ncbi:hypothetical protein VTK73DRAFT_8582 [Phialemonium thermophilum]|uniref:Uncharacterized protein n=1 Tax=Phialemonium thermophilum TaxID=223376 RepID=A0ABR3W7T8_9PEZI
MLQSMRTVTGLRLDYLVGGDSEHISEVLNRKTNIVLERCRLGYPGEPASLLDATAGDHNSVPPSESQRRWDLVRHSLPGRLPQLLPVALPAEILAMIAALLIPEGLIVTTSEQARATQEIVSQAGSRVDLRRNVYVRFSEFEGRMYISRLSNDASGAAQGRELPFLDAGQANGVSEMWYAEDTFGLRWIQYGGLEPSNIKIRELSYCPELEQGIERETMGWKTPDHPPQSNIAGLRMPYFDCNAPGTTGYSVATDGHRLFAIQAHHRGHYEGIDFYEHASSVCVWIYIPMDVGEHLTEICRRWDTSGATGMALIVRDLSLC